MPALNFSVPHQLGKQEAKSRLDDLFPSLESKYASIISDTRYEWLGDRCDFSLSIKGMNASGQIDVRETQVDLDLDLPFAAVFFKDKIRETIASQAAELLSAGK
jgi:hypothetical protein